MSQGRQRLAMSRPKQGAAGRTEFWRISKPVVDKDKCDSCGICRMYCPDNAIDGNIEIDLEFCKGCGICANECPKKAIEMVRDR